MNNGGNAGGPAGAQTSYLHALYYKKGKVQYRQIKHSATEHKGDDVQLSSNVDISRSVSIEESIESGNQMSTKKWRSHEGEKGFKNRVGAGTLFCCVTKMRFSAISIYIRYLFACIMNLL